MNDKIPTDKPSWAVRRKVIFAALVFCAACVVWVMVWGDTRSVNDIIVMCAFGLAFSTIGSYVFGAVWDDKNYMTLARGEPPTASGFPPDPNES
jgi:hypothetical protein